MLHLICALKCEARPLIECFNLVHHGREDIFNCYHNEDREMSLTITGVGKINAAAGTMHAQSRFGIRETDAWLNVGIAGHGTMPLGTPLLANRINDIASGDIWYPQFVFRSPFRSCGLKTVASPSCHYDEDMVDMEAAGFYASVVRSGTSELIHSLKIISDNELSHRHNISKKFITELLADKINIIELLADGLLELSAEISLADSGPDHYQTILKKWHFTQCQRHRLFFLLQRWQALRPEHEPLVESGIHLRKGSDVLDFLEQMLDATPVNFSSRPLQTTQSNTC